jgi:hypothetical protein
MNLPEGLQKGDTMMERVERVPRPEIEIDGIDLNQYRKLGTSLRPGTYKELYNGTIVYNAGYGSANLKIFTPKTPEYEAMLEEFRNRRNY